MRLASIFLALLGGASVSFTPPQEDEPDGHPTLEQVVGRLDAAEDDAAFASAVALLAELGRLESEEDALNEVRRLFKMASMSRRQILAEALLAWPPSSRVMAVTAEASSRIAGAYARLTPFRHEPDYADWMLIGEGGDPLQAPDGTPEELVAFLKELAVLELTLARSLARFPEDELACSSLGMMMGQTVGFFRNPVPYSERSRHLTEILIDVGHADVVVPVYRNLLACLRDLAQLRQHLHAPSSAPDIWRGVPIRSEKDLMAVVESVDAYLEFTFGC